MQFQNKYLALKKYSKGTTYIVAVFGLWPRDLFTSWKSVLTSLNVIKDGLTSEGGLWLQTRMATGFRFRFSLRAEINI